MLVIDVGEINKRVSHVSIQMNSPKINKMPAFTGIK